MINRRIPCRQCQQGISLFSKQDYKVYQEDRGNDLRGIVEVIIAKHRNGVIGEVLPQFKGEFTRFSNPEDDIVVQANNSTILRLKIKLRPNSLE